MQTRAHHHDHAYAYACKGEHEQAHADKQGIALHKATTRPMALHACEKG